MLTGGVAITSLIKPTLAFSERFEYFLNKVIRYTWFPAISRWFFLTRPSILSRPIRVPITHFPFSFVGNEYVGFNNSLSLSLKDHSNRLYAIGHYLRENKVFSDEHKVRLSHHYRLRNFILPEILQFRFLVVVV